MILGRITGRVTTTRFDFIVTSSKTRKLQFAQVNHEEYGFVLCQIMELERTSEEMIAHCNIIGYKDHEGRIKGIRTPFSLGTEVLEAQDSFIKEIIKLDGEGAFIGNLEGKDIPVTMSLQKVLTRHLAVLAKSGAGKSYTVGVLLEEIMEKNVPLVIIDPHGEYSSMKEASQEKELLMRWKLEPKRYSQQIQEFGDISVTQDAIPLKLNEQMSSYELMKMLPIQLSNTQESILFSVVKDLDVVTFDNILFGLEEVNSSNKWAIIDTIQYLRDLKLFASSYTSPQELVQPGKCSIINLKGVSPEVQDVIVYKLMKDLFQERKRENIPPFFCIIEEAHNFCPEKGFGKSKSTEVIRLISSEGRKFGLGLCVVSQRPALVQKTVLAQCSTQIIMKVTNPNDLRAIAGSIEGFTSETEDEIQSLPVGNALVCGIVDRPLVVKIRPRRSKHGGHAVDVLGAAKTSPEEYQKDVVKEAKEFEDKNLVAVIKPKTSIKDLHLMADKPIQKITTYLIPALFVTTKIHEQEYSFLIDKIKGKIIIDPETDEKEEISQIGPASSFFRRPVYESIGFDIKIDEKISTNQIVEEVKRYTHVEKSKDCFIIFHKVSFEQST